jgi:hydroxymethylpyrimidine kinase/phosphomethylpyrimidine kinase
VTKIEAIEAIATIEADNPSSGARPVALTIAGLDPSGGAGVIADIRTFLALECFPTAAITSVTFQNAKSVFGAEHLSAETVRAQVLPLLEDYDIAGAKTGMLPTAEIVVEVARLFRETDLPAPVVDPVIRSTSGYQLIGEDAVKALIEELIPLARLITPNIPEAERITGLSITDEEGMRRAARVIRALGARAVLIKGGHLRGQEAGGRRQEAVQAIDVLDDQGQVKVFRGEWIDASEVHGTGCMLSAAIAACLGRGTSLEESVGAAKRFVTDAIIMHSRSSPSPS